MRNPNGYGSIKKLSGKRRKPYGVYVTTEWKIVNGVAKQVQKAVGYFATRSEAMIVLADYNKSPYDLQTRGTTFEDIYTILYKEKFEAMPSKSRSSYVSSYNKCGSLYSMKMAEIKKVHLQAVINSHADKSKPLQKNIIKLFNAIYTFALENDIIEKNYAEFVTVTSEQETRERVPFTRDEVARLWQNVGMNYVDSILIMIYSGLRIGELLELKAEDIDIESRCMNIRGTKTKAAQRIVPIHQKIMPLLMARMTNGYLFKNQRGNKVIYQAFKEKQFDVIMQSLEMKHTPHECRHSFATYAAASKLNPVLLKKIIGHATQDLTQDTYTHAFIEDLIVEIDKFTV